jgi:O-antigen/teichoic acid export membrane protein
VGIGDTDFGVQVGIGFVGRVVGALLAFVGSIVLARALGPTDYGVFYLLLSVVAFLDNPMTGWAQACRKRLTEAEFPAGDAIGSTVAGIVLASGIVFVGAWLFAPQIASFTGSRDGWLLLSFLFAGMIAYHTANEVLKSTERFGASPWLNAGRDLVRVLVQVGLVLAGLGVAGMVGGMVLANFVVAPTVLYLVGVRPSIPSVDSLRSIWSYARYSIPGGFVGTAQHRIDRILLGFLVSTTAVGNYEVAMKLTLPAMFIAGVAQDGLMGRISNLQSRGEEFAADVRRNLGFASLIGIPLFFGALVMAEPVIVTLYSNQYATAGPFLIGLAFFRLLRTQKSILVAVINGLDHPDLNLKISTVVFSFNIVAGLAGLYAIGPIGVVVATILSEIIGYGVRGYVVRSIVPSVRFLPRPLLDQIASGAVMAITVYAARLTLPLQEWYYVLFVVAIGGLTYLTVLVVISEYFRSTVRGIAADAGLRA